MTYIDQFTGGPIQTTILSFKALKNEFEAQLQHERPFVRQQAEYIMQLFNNYPVLEQGIKTEKTYIKNKPVIDELLSFLFPEALTHNEIKAAILPLTGKPIYMSQRLLKLTQGKNENFNLIGKNNYEKREFRRLIYAIILNKYYNYKIDFRRPLYVEIPQPNGDMRTYRVAMNADYLDIYPNKKAIEITPEILDELLAYSEDFSAWEKYFPEKSWVITGFGLINLIDVTLDTQIAKFKEDLISPKTDLVYHKVVNDLKGIFNLPDLRVGTSVIDPVTNQLTSSFHPLGKSLILKKGEHVNCRDFSCQDIYKRIFQDKKEVVISNVDSYSQKRPESLLGQNLKESNIKSIMIIPISWKDELTALLEIGSARKNDLNSINKVKLDDILPNIQSVAKRSQDEFRNLISAVIQEECTSIHPAVQWKFEEEAIRYIQAQTDHGQPHFNEIVFEEVYPLYGQIDIVGSSFERNHAIQHDLKLQLKNVIDLLKRLISQKQLPYYEQLIFQTENHLLDVENDFQSNSEQTITNFLKRDILPVFQQVEQEGILPNQYVNLVKDLKQNSLVSNAQNQYNSTVDSINRELGLFIEKRQKQAQQIFPHYFEKYKTDGIEHNIYVGQSINKMLAFNKTVLYNLRLWQLQTIVEMERHYYSFKKELPLQLDMASLILVHDVPMSIRYRIDEKRFDVDGAYNVRYELVKKRIDKAYLKNTKERLTQVGKISIVYSNQTIEREYLKYLEFLKAKNLITDDIDQIDVEDLQGLTGLRALRATINFEANSKEKLFTYQDLLSNIL